MESLYNYTDYRRLLEDRIAELPRKGYGAIGRLATAIGVHGSLISQILRGQKSLTPEQAILTASFLGLTDLETEFFLVLVQLDRAGNNELRTYYQAKLNEIKKKSVELVNRLPAEQQLTEEAKAIFYSNWLYTAIRQATAIQELTRAEAIAEHFHIPVKRVREALDFLVLHGLCREVDGEYSVGPQSTHVPSSSPWSRVHHVNWRERAIDRMNHDDPLKLHYTSPLTIAESDARVVREMIVAFLENVNKVVDPSPSEELRCLNIDWFKI